MTASVSSSQKPIVLAFSGGLDTSFCIPWLKETYKRPIVTVTVNCGGIDAAAARQLDERARALGASDHRLIEARPEFFEKVIKFLIMGNVKRGNMYPLCVGAELLRELREVLRLQAALGADAKRVHVAALDVAHDQELQHLVEELGPRLDEPVVDGAERARARRAAAPRPRRSRRSSR